MRWRRRKNITDPKEQVFFALEYVYLAFGFVALSAFVLFVPPFNMFFGAQELAAQLSNSLMQLVLMQWPMIIMSAIIVFVIGILLSNRLFGAMYGLRKTIEDRHKGDLQVRARVRKYDYLMPLVKSLNDLFESDNRLREQISERAQKIQENAKQVGNVELEQEAAEILSMIKQKTEQG